MKKEVKLYNALFPFWLLKYLAPILWGVVIIGNFAIDSFVLYVAMSVLHIEDIGKFYKSHIVKIFVFGLLADIIGSSFMFMLMVCFRLGNMGDEWYLTVPAIIISGACIFLLNYFITFKKCEKDIRRKLALTFAVATAPYTFLIPSMWLYG